MASPRNAPASTALCGLVALLACSGTVLAQSSLALRDGSVVIRTEDCTRPINQTLLQEGPASRGLQKTQDALLFANTIGRGEDARKEFSEAYVCMPSELRQAGGGMPQEVEEMGLTLCNATNPFDSFMYVESNNTFVLLPNTTERYVSLGARLLENNTLALESADISMFRSTLELSSFNWFDVLNSTFMLDNSALRQESFFSWWVENSTVMANSSVLRHHNALLHFNNSEVRIANSSWSLSGDEAMMMGAEGYEEGGGEGDMMISAPGPYEGQVFPALLVNQSSLMLDGTEWNVRNMPDMWIVNSTLSLGFSTLNLYNSKLHLWRSALELNRSKIQLFNSTIVLLCDSTLPADALVNTDLPQVEELDRGAVLGETAKDASVLKSVVDIPLVEAEAA